MTCHTASGLTPSAATLSLPKPVYAKIFIQIFDSSIADNYHLRHFFMDLLVLADLNGVVDMTPAAIAARTRIPLPSVKAMLTELEKPDPESRSEEEDGRRLERLDAHRTWGWHIINYERFRQIATEEQRRESTRLRVARFKEKRQQKPSGNAQVTPGNAQVTPGNAQVTPGNAQVTPPYASAWYFCTWEWGCGGRGNPH